jgi:hypothetical protein
VFAGSPENRCAVADSYRRYARGEHLRDRLARWKARESANSALALLLGEAQGERIRGRPARTAQCVPTHARYVPRHHAGCERRGAQRLGTASHEGATERPSERPCGTAHGRLRAIDWAASWPHAQRGDRRVGVANRRREIATFAMVSHYGTRLPAIRWCVRQCPTMNRTSTNDVVQPSRFGWVSLYGIGSR